MKASDLLPALQVCYLCARSHERANELLYGKGNNRWRPPQAPGALHGVQQSSPPPQCPQANFGQNPLNPYDKRAEKTDPEDCLFLK